MHTRLKANTHKNSWTVSSMGGTVSNLDPLSLSILFFCSVSKCYSAEAVWVPVRLLSSLKCDLHFDSLSLLARHARHYTLAITKKINDKNVRAHRWFLHLMKSLSQKCQRMYTRDTYISLSTLAPAVCNSYRILPVTNKIINSEVKELPNQDEFQCFIAMVETLHNSNCCELVRLARLGNRYELTSTTLYHANFLAWWLLIDLIITTGELGEAVPSSGGERVLLNLRITVELL